MFPPPSAPRRYRFPLAAIQARYGAGNYDDAGDAIAAALALACADADPPRLGFDFDAVHSNPWFHALVVSVHGLTPDQEAGFRARLAQAGLVPEPE